MRYASPVYHTLLNRYRAAKRARERQQYLAGGRVPWALGYWDYRNAYIADALNDSALFERFTSASPLPAGYGARLDERTVEYPWVLARLGAGKGHLLDGGSALNIEFLLDHPRLKDKTIVIYNLAPEETFGLPNVSYLYGDLRETILKDALFDAIACISTLEHIGMDNTLLYTADANFGQANTRDYRLVLNEFRRLLKPGGKLLLTVPYGRYENHGWLQQFDAALVDDVSATFGGSASTAAYYRYTPNGCTLSDAAACAECSYYNIHAVKQPAPDGAAAARAVACIEMIK